MPKAITDIIDQHVEEASFLWLLRQAAIWAPHYLLADLIRLEGRVEAHLDGIRVAGTAGWSVCRQALESIGEPGEVFAAAVLAFEDGDSSKIEAVRGAVDAKPETAEALASALGWMRPEHAAPHVKSLLAAESTVLQRAGIVAATLHRHNPGPALMRALGSPDPLLGIQAMRSAAELGLVDMHLAIRANLKADDTRRRFWAAWATVLLTGHRDGVGTLQALAETGGPFAERAAALAMRKLPLTEARLWHKRMAAVPTRCRATIAGIGALGDPAAVPWLIEQMTTPPLARVAGEAVSMITGVHIAYDKLEGQKPDDFHAGPTEDPADDDVAMDADEHLAWPAQALVQAWWGKRRGDFARDTRHLVGRPVTAESLHVTLRQAYQRQRNAAAIELALLQPGKPLFNVRAPGVRQQALLK